jgi:hypothetical protein
MAFIYLTGGQVLKVPSSREAIANDMAQAGAGQTRMYDLPRGSARPQTQVTVLLASIAAVSDDKLPGTDGTSA